MTNIQELEKVSTFEEFKTFYENNNLIANEKNVKSIEEMIQDKKFDSYKAAIKEMVSMRNNIIETNSKTDKLLFLKCSVPQRYVTAQKSDIPKNLWQECADFQLIPDKGLFLHGKAGTGKTHLAVALMKEYILNMKLQIVLDREAREVLKFQNLNYPYFTSIPDILMEIRATFKNNSETTEENIINKYTERITETWQGSEGTSYAFMVLDDLGVEKTTDWSLQTLYAIIDHRYRNMKKTIITSNLNLNELSDKLGDRIASRIAGMCKTIEIKGKDRRINP